MFTGIISDVGQIIDITQSGALNRLRIASAYDATTIALGASIANSGACLTVVGVELGGHMVSGHVDGVAEILSRRDFDGMAHFRFRAPTGLAKFVAVKGSVALDGTSLTVNAVDGETFEVLLIPHTLKVTTWGERQAGDTVNIEVDQMARYAARLMEAGRGGA